MQGGVGRRCRGSVGAVVLGQCRGSVGHWRWGVWSVTYLRKYTPRNAERVERLLVIFPEILALRCLGGGGGKNGKNRKNRYGRKKLKGIEWDLLYGDLNDEDKVGVVNGKANGEFSGKGGRANGTSSGSTKKDPNTKSKATDKSKEIEIDPATLTLHKLQHYLLQAYEESTTDAQANILYYLQVLDMSSRANALGDALSGCDKIVQTPIPLSYSRHTSRCLTIWAGFLPLAIVKELGWLSIPVMLSVSWLLYGIEEIGHLIEQPFVPVSENPTYTISSIANDNRSDGSGVEENEYDYDDDRASMTKPYDIGLPVCSVAEKIRTEVQSIVSL